MKILAHTILLVLSLSTISNLTAQLRVSKLFSDNMVLQREAEVPVWGWGDKGAPVEVTFQEKTYKTKVTKNGEWKVILPQLPFGGPYAMSIKSKGNTINYINIYLGDVWLCSGQSNMEWPVRLTNNAEKEIAGADDVLIRHFKVPNSYEISPSQELAGGSWEVTGPETVGNFTAVGYYFARELRKNVQIPIGLLNTSWGGSRIEPWMHSEVLNLPMDKQADQVINKYREEIAKRRKSYEEQFGPLSETDQGMNGETAIWSKVDLDESQWVNMTLPALWERAGYGGLDGIGWFRKTIELIPEEASQAITLSLGMIDDSDIVWVNGQKVGGMEQAWNEKRVYEVSASVLNTGRNVITIRVEDTGGGGGIHGDPTDMFIRTSSRKPSLAGDWKFRIGAMRGETVLPYNQIPTILYNKMIHPLLNFPIKGVLWYQGESNAGNETDATNYQDLFPTMITDWRTRWDIGDFPFLWVQLANWQQPDELPVNHPWAVIREAQTMTLNRVPNTAQAVIIDIGEADDIHPRNKQDVGYRLSLGARNLAYAQDVVYSGPMYKSHEVDGDEIVISFDYLGSGLLVRDKYGYVKGFAIAGQDGKFVWATARKDGDKVVVWNNKIENPVHVRYAWGINPDDANLYNKEGLPAVPFRTDK